jgi:signal transduction histidine kinase
VDVDVEGRLVMARPPADPRFDEPLSGLYWQLGDDRGHFLRSRSLWDTTLSLPDDQPSPAEVHRHEIEGPRDARVLVAERSVNLTVGDQRAPVRVVVAADLQRVSVSALAFAKDLAVGLGVLAAVLVIATSIQVGLGLRPLDALRRGIADIRSGVSQHLPSNVPAEVQPLVEEVNALLDTQEREIERSRGRAADLAHGLKTPLSALAADARRLRDRGEHVIARDIEAVGAAMSRYVDRELARARVRGAVRHKGRPSIEVAPLVRSLIATIVRTPFGQRATFELRVPEDVRVPMDRTDLAEVLGNLLDNAARHAASTVRVTATVGPCGPSISVQDDGQGIAPTARTEVVERGARLDERGNGAGLGLAIVQDVLEAYGWRLDLSTSPLGGLSATIAPARPQSLSAATDPLSASPSQPDN